MLCARSLWTRRQPGSSLPPTCRTPKRPPSRAGPSERRRGLPRELRWLVPVLLVIALAVVAVFVVPGLLEDEENGIPGPGGGPNSAQPVQVREVTDFDPLGDNSEHLEEVGNAVDGNPSTTWSTESYSTPMHEQKDGVGLVVDLGDPTTVSEVVIQSPTPGYTLELRYAGDDGPEIDSLRNRGRGVPGRRARAHHVRRTDRGSLLAFTANPPCRRRIRRGRDL